MVEMEKMNIIPKVLCRSEGGEVSHSVQSSSNYFLLFSLSSAAPTEPLLCKFADGGQKKRQSQSKYPQNGRPWHREGEVRLHVSISAKGNQLQTMCSYWACSGKLPKKGVCQKTKTKMINVLVFTYRNFES